MAVRNIALEFKKKGHQISILTNRYRRDLSASQMIDGIPVERYFFTALPPNRFDFWIFIKYCIRVLLIPVTFLRLLYKLSNEKPDIVHLHFVGAPALYLCFVKQIVKFPLILSFHGADIEVYDRKPGFEKWFIKRSFDMANFVTANSAALLTDIFRFLKKNKKTVAEVVPMAFSFEDHETGQAHTHARPYLFSAGRFVPKKGFDVLIRAFANVKNKGLYCGDLILAGEGEERAVCERLARDLGIDESVRFLGTAEHAKVISFIKGCDLFVMPSRFEAFGITLLEALYSGKKVVASRVGGMVELMNKNPDYLVEPDNPDALGKKIQAVLNGLPWNPVDPGELRRKYNWEKTADSFLEIYQRVIRTGNV